jgi:catechol 2,3-dioxygenase-like lactoylglutathione lyase family enzyme
MTTPGSRAVIDHVDLLVSDLDASLRFYQAALEPLGFGIIDQSETSFSFGVDGADDFGINLIAPGDTPTRSAHVAFVAESREAVDAFYEAAVAAGGTLKSAPSLHPEYHEGYYGAFVYDPDGNNIEAVYHDYSMLTFTDSASGISRR